MLSALLPAIVATTASTMLYSIVPATSAIAVRSHFVTNGGWACFSRTSLFPHSVEAHASCVGVTGRCTRATPRVCDDPLPRGEGRPSAWPYSLRPGRTLHTDRCALRGHARHPGDRSCGHLERRFELPPTPCCYDSASSRSEGTVARSWRTSMSGSSGTPLWSGGRWGFFRGGPHPHHGRMPRHMEEEGRIPTPGG